MNRKFWISSSSDFKRVRLSGRSYAHPLVLIIIAEGAQATARAGIITGKSVGNAVTRNLAKRRIRAILCEYLAKIKQPVDLVVIARKKVSNAEFSEIRNAIQKLLVQANLLSKNDCL